MDVLILGIKGSGKSTLAKRYAQAAKEAGTKVIRLDPTLDSGYADDFHTDNVEEFVKVFWASRHCLAIVEEAGITVGRYDEDMQKIAMLGRHPGHKIFYVAQRATSISKLVRDQCSELYLFASSFDDSLTHAKEWSKPALKQAVSLQPGEYYHTSRFGGISKGNIFQEKKA